MTQFKMNPEPPFRLDLTVWVLRRVPNNEIDRWDQQTYRRVLAVSGKAVEVAVTQTGPCESPEITVEYDAGDEPSIACELNKLLGLDTDLSDFCRLAESDDQFSSLLNRYAGFKPPRFSSVFEALVNGVACQQISLAAGLSVLNRLSASFGLAAGKHRAFPRPEDLVCADVEDLRNLGFSRRKSQVILSIASAIVEGSLDLEALQLLDDSLAVSTLCELKGVGRWTAEYIALRGLGRLDVYPADDVGSQNKLQKWLGLGDRPDYNAVHQLVDRWSPYRGLIYFLLLLDGRAQMGLLPSTEMTSD